MTGDNIFNGADDDASGSTAVLELAEALATGKPKAHGSFRLFGSEEIGGWGARYFQEHPPVPSKALCQS
jgi:Zn-dependent M28 family amino/carboxypeptidase